jgi:hypothetical protein
MMYQPVKDHLLVGGDTGYQRLSDGFKTYRNTLTSWHGVPEYSESTPGIIGNLFERYI